MFFLHRFRLLTNKSSKHAKTAHFEIIKFKVIHGQICVQNMESDLGNSFQHFADIPLK